MKAVKNNLFFIFSIVIAFLFWFVESLLHMAFFDHGAGFEIIPHDANELWMRIVIFTLIPLIGFLASRYVKLQSKIQEEKLRNLNAVIVSTHEVAGNTLSLMSHYCDDFIKTGKPDIDTIISMKEIIDEAFDSLNNLKSVDEMIKQENKQNQVRQH